MIDIKEQYQERADDLAQEVYDKDFELLSSTQQYHIWKEAEQDVIDNNVERAERMCGE